MAAFLGISLSELETKVWLDHFEKYPKWKLLKACSDYSLDERGGGRTLAHLCKWMNDLIPQPEPISAREDQGYKKLEYKPNRELGRETIAYALDMMSKIHTPADMDKAELDFVIAMRRRFPQVNWQCGRKANEGR